MVCYEVWLGTTFAVKQAFGALYLIFLIILFVFGLVTFVPVVAVLQFFFSLCLLPFSRATKPPHHHTNTKNLATATLTTSPAAPPVRVRSIQLAPTKQHKIAIVGAGWTGVHLTKLLVERGMEVEVFEKLDDIGGTWHPSNSYKGLHLHSATWSNEFPDFPYPDKSRQNTKLSAEEMLTYMRAFAEHNNVFPHIRFNTTVTHIKYHSSTNMGSIALRDNVTGEVWEQNDYDLVVIATFCATPKLPRFQGSENFSGRIVHSSALGADWLEKQLGQGAASTHIVPRRPHSLTVPTAGNSQGQHRSSTLKPFEKFMQSEDRLVLPVSIKSELDSARTVSSSGSARVYWSPTVTPTPNSANVRVTDFDLAQPVQARASASPRNSGDSWVSHSSPVDHPSPQLGSMPSVLVQGSPPPSFATLSGPHGSLLAPPSISVANCTQPNIVVLGASKSATDILQLMSRSKGTQNANVVWLHRRCYHFFKYECFSHTRSAFGMFRGFCVVLGMPLVLLAPWMYCLFNLLCGAFVWPVNFHLDFRRFHFGVLDSTQAQIVQQFPRVEGEVEMLTPTGIRLTNGCHIAADIIVCATGYTTGVPQIQVECDGEQVDLLKQTSLFHHMFVPEVPILAITVTSLVSFGPIRAVTLAQHIDWYLSRRNPGPNSTLKPLTPQHMRHVANKNLLKQSVNESLLFSSYEPMLSAALKYHMDLILVGATRPWEIMLYMMSLFVLNHQRAVHLNVSPPKARKTQVKAVLLPEFKPHQATVNQVQVV